MMMIVIYLALVCLAGYLIYLIYHTDGPTDLIGGSRSSIFSRFRYEPDFPMISKMDQNLPDRLSKRYNSEGPVQLFAGRPYEFYSTNDSTWVNPWHFPEQVNGPCLQAAMDQCHEHMTLVKSDEDKLSGLAAATPKDVVNVSACFDRVYKQCVRPKQAERIEVNIKSSIRT
jgi:hypothetical protein